MSKRQVLRWHSDALALQTERLGPLPLINHFLKRLDLEARLERVVDGVKPRLFACAADVVKHFVTTS